MLLMMIDMNWFLFSIHLYMYAITNDQYFTQSSYSYMENNVAEMKLATLQSIEVYRDDVAIVI